MPVLTRNTSPKPRKALEGGKNSKRDNDAAYLDFTVFYLRILGVSNLRIIIIIGQFCHINKYFLKKFELFRCFSCSFPKK
jgi:hypothetical protein